MSLFAAGCAERGRWRCRVACDQPATTASESCHLHCPRLPVAGTPSPACTCPPRRWPRPPRPARPPTPSTAWRCWRRRVRGGGGGRGGGFVERRALGGMGRACKAQGSTLTLPSPAPPLLPAGIVTVPGSGFGQEEGTFHLRTTILPPGARRRPLCLCVAVSATHRLACLNRATSAHSRLTTAIALHDAPPRPCRGEDPHLCQALPGLPQEVHGAGA